MAADGAVLEGEFKDGKLHGHRKDVVATGDVYEGQWKEGKRHGKGRYVSADGGIYDDRPATAGPGPAVVVPVLPLPPLAHPQIPFLEHVPVLPRGVCVFLP